MRLRVEVDGETKVNIDKSAPFLKKHKTKILLGIAFVLWNQNKALKAHVRVQSLQLAEDAVAMREAAVVIKSLISPAELAEKTQL